MEGLRDSLVDQSKKQLASLLDLDRSWRGRELKDQVQGQRNVLEEAKERESKLKGRQRYRRKSMKEKKVMLMKK